MPFYLKQLHMFKMTNLTQTLILFFTLLYSSCPGQETTWGQEATKQEEEAAFKNAKFDKQVVRNIDKYNVLKDFLLNNLDTIINYRNSKNKVTFVGAKSHVDSIRQVNESCWDFTVAYGPIDISHVPNFLYPKLESLIKDLGENMFDNFTICADNTLTFNIRFINDYRKNNLNVLHQLTWNKIDKKEYGYDFIKDSLLQDKWIYNICVFKDEGW